MNIKQMAKKGKAAAKQMAEASSSQKNEVLNCLIKHLSSSQEAILQTNQKDVILAKEKGLADSLQERLSLDGRLEGMIEDIAKLSTFPDPIGEIFERKSLPNGLLLSKARTPLGLIGVIYESRPNVTIEISALTLKSGNCALLRGGQEALNTNKILIELIQKALIANDLPLEAIQLLTNGDREEVREMLRCEESIDLIIPRGGAELQQFCLKHSTIPVITGGIGICHLFVDASVDVEQALKVILNAKTDRPAVCNALDTLLIHQALAPTFIPHVINELKKKGVIFRLDAQAMKLINDSSCSLAEANDWDKEWLSLVLGIKIVEGLDEAIAHIQAHSSGHSDGILTENPDHADRFIQCVDSAAIYINASTRFTDGGQFGLGGEVAVSTQKFHARGPMGLNALTSYKWIIRGNYQVKTS